jgi:hypothetical protein
LISRRSRDYFRSSQVFRIFETGGDAGFQSAD